MAPVSKEKMLTAKKSLSHTPSHRSLRNLVPGGYIKETLMMICFIIVRVLFDRTFSLMPKVCRGDPGTQVWYAIFPHHGGPEIHF